MKGAKLANPTLPPVHPSLSRDLDKVHSLADLFDRSIGLPGTKFRIGVDGLIGLIPGVGDALGLAPLAYYVFIARRHRLPVSIYLKMAGNHLIDFLVGLVPLVGDLLDFAHKANLKNARLIEQELRKRQSFQQKPVEKVVS